MAPAGTAGKVGTVIDTLNGTSLTQTQIIIIAVVSSVVVLLSIGGYTYWRRRRNRKEREKMQETRQQTVLRADQLELGSSRQHIGVFPVGAVGQRARLAVPEHGLPIVTFSMPWFCTWIVVGLGLSFDLCLHCRDAYKTKASKR